jgi:endonuclease
MVDEFTNIFDKALQDNHTLVAFANCEVHYSGRAESELERGDRVIVVKSDNALLVHQPSGSNPVNHMRSGGRHKLQKEGLDEGEVLRIVSEHTKHKEHLTIKIYELHFYHAKKLIDNESIFTRGTEYDMSEMLYNKPEMISPEFKPLSREEHTKYGFIDVFGYDQNNNLVIVECKRTKADLHAVTQLRRYVEKIKESKGIKNVTGMVASPQISDNALAMLKDWGFTYKQISPPRDKEERDKKQQRLAI